MKDAGVFIPFLDALFLTLLSLLALQIGTMRVEALPVKLAEVGGGSAAAERTREPAVLSLTRDGRLFLGKKEVEREDLESLPSGKPLILRADAGVAYEKVVDCLARLRQLERDVLLQVKTVAHEERNR